jgi:hypothetical protein
MECASYMNLTVGTETLLQKSKQNVFALVLLWEFS